MCPTAAALNFEALASKQSDLIDGLALSLFVFWILADYSDTTFSFDDLAFLADRFNRWSYFHVNPPFSFLAKTHSCACSWWKNPVFAHKKERIHKSSSYSIASSLKIASHFFQFFSWFFSLSTLLHTKIFSRAFPSLPYLLFLSSLYPKTGTRGSPPPSEVLSSSLLLPLSQTSTSRILPPSATWAGNFELATNFDYVHEGQRTSRKSA